MSIFSLREAQDGRQGEPAITREWKHFSKIHESHCKPWSCLACSYLSWRVEVITNLWSRRDRTTDRPTEWTNFTKPSACAAHCSVSLHSYKLEWSSGSHNTRLLASNWGNWMYSGRSLNPNFLWSFWGQISKRCDSTTVVTTIIFLLQTTHQLWCTDIMCTCILWYILPFSV